MWIPVLDPTPVNHLLATIGLVAYFSVVVTALPPRTSLWATVLALSPTLLLPALFAAAQRTLLGQAWAVTALLLPFILATVTALLVRGLWQVARTEEHPPTDPEDGVPLRALLPLLVTTDLTGVLLGFAAPLRAWPAPMVLCGLLGLVAVQVPAVRRQPRARRMMAAPLFTFIGMAVWLLVALVRGTPPAPPLPGPGPAEHFPGVVWPILLALFGLGATAAGQFPLGSGRGQYSWRTLLTEKSGPWLMVQISIAGGLFGLMAFLLPELASLPFFLLGSSGLMLGLLMGLVGRCLPGFSAGDGTSGPSPSVNTDKFE